MHLAPRKLVLKQHWIVLVLLITLIGFVYTGMLVWVDLQFYEVELMPSSFRGEFDYYDERARNSHARFIHADTLSDGGDTVLISPLIDLGPGDYRVSLSVRALQTWPEDRPLQMEVRQLERDNF